MLNILKLNIAIIVIFMLVFSGSTLYALNTLIEFTHECSCVEDEPLQAPEEINCNKDCCTFTEAKEQNLEDCIPVKSKINENKLNLFADLFKSIYDRSKNIAFKENLSEIINQNTLHITTKLRI